MINCGLQNHQIVAPQNICSEKGDRIKNEFEDMINYLLLTKPLGFLVVVFFFLLVFCLMIFANFPRFFLIGGRKIPDSQEIS